MISAWKLAAAYGLDWILGDPEWFPHPVRLIGSAINAGTRYAQPTGDRPAVELARGTALSFGVTGLSAMLAEQACALGPCVEALLAWTTLTTLAAIVLEEAIQDEAYAEETLRCNLAERESLASALTRLGAEIFPSHANFLLVRLKDGWPDSTATRDLLLQQRGIAVRDCNSYVGLPRGKYIRVAVRTASENLQLLDGLRGVWN